MTRKARDGSRRERLRSNTLRSVVSIVGLASLAGISSASANEGSPIKNPTIPTTTAPTTTVPTVPTTPRPPTVPTTTVPGTRPITVNCAARATAELCRDDSYRECLGKLEECRPILQSGFQAAFSTDLDVSTERYQELDDQREIIAGKTRRTPRVMGDLLANGIFTYEGRENLAQARAQAKDVTPSALYTRNPTWTANGPQVNSCDEYVYEKYYDYMRFVDAANSCKRDPHCVVDVAYAKGNFQGTPFHMPSNIADRPLAGRSLTTAGGERRVYLDALPLSQGVIPKNPFYTGAILLSPKLRQVLAASHPSWAATLDDVAARAHAGTNYYRWGVANVQGGPPVVRGFSNEFRFHNTLRELTRDVPAPEMDAHRKRSNAFVDAYSAFVTEAYCANVHNVAACANVPKLRQLGFLEFVGGDPYIRTHVLANPRLRNDAMAFALTHRAARLDASGNNFIPVTPYDLGLPSVPGSGQTIPGTGGGGGIALPPGVTHQVLPPGSGGDTIPTPNWNPDPTLDPQSLWQTGNNGGFGLTLNNAWLMDPPVADASSPTPRLDCSGEGAKSKFRFLACEATNMVLDELSRDNPGCFDKNYNGCDWHPQDFADRFHTTSHYMLERKRAYDTCIRWTSNDFGSIDATHKKNFETLEAHMQTREDDFNKFPAPRVMSSDYPNRIDRFGESVGENMSFGAKDTFGGGFEYLAGWGSHVKTRKPGTNEICRMDFTADAKFVGWASAFGMVENVVDAGAHLKVNQENRGEAWFFRKFIVLRRQLVQPENVRINQSIPLISKHESKKQSIFSSFYPLPFGAFVTLDVGVELGAGVTFDVKTRTPNPNGVTCSGTDAMGIDALLLPYAKASIYGSATASWLGLLSGGLEVELDLIRADLPIRARGGIGVNTATNKPELTFDLTGELALKTLSGKIETCGCLAFFCGCTDLVKWPGIDLGTVELFKPISAKQDLTLF